MTCEEVTKNTLENLRIFERNSKKSIGLDTRDMVLLNKKMTLVTAGTMGLLYWKILIF